MDLLQTISLMCGGPGSGRRPLSDQARAKKHLEKLRKKRWKNLSDDERRKVAFNDSRQMTLPLRAKRK